MIESGQRYNRLVALEFVSCGRNSQNLRWRFKCDCGREHEALVAHVRRGNTKSCGCLRSEVSTAKLITHGMTGSPEYLSWFGMIDRCRNQNNHAYSDYGGRGIRVCDRWENFGTFLADMGRKPSKKHSLDRIDNNGNYEPINCRWATAREQANNRRNSIEVSFAGQSMPLKEACILAGLKYGTVRARIVRNGWDAELALSKPTQRRPS
jgi:hypothetical protein